MSWQLVLHGFTVVGLAKCATEYMKKNERYTEG